MNVKFAEQTSVVDRPGEYQDAIGSYEGVAYETLDFDADRIPDLFCQDNQCAIFSGAYRLQAMGFLTGSTRILAENLGNPAEKKQAVTLLESGTKLGWDTFIKFKRALIVGGVRVGMRSFMGSPQPTIVFRDSNNKEYEVFLDRNYPGMSSFELMSCGFPVNEIAIVDRSSNSYQYVMHRYVDPVFFQSIQDQLDTLDEQERGAF